ncbi:MAG: ABC transporter substrate-binding protein [Thermoleophilia bacterium]
MRRTTFRLLLTLIMVLAVAGVGCSEDTVTTTSLSETEPGVTPPAIPGGSDEDEVVLVVAADAFTSLDPAAASSTGDLLLLHQVYEWLTEEDGKGGFQPGLALSWERTGPAVWTFKLRPNVTFQDGGTFGAKDVVHTFERLRLLADSTGVGSPLADFGVIESVVAVDESTVRFVLGRPYADFGALVARDAAAILSGGVREPSREWVGTGPFALWSYRADQGAVLKRNPTYWMRDSGGRQLPYVDGMNIVFESDPEKRLAALGAGRVHFVGGLDLEGARLVEASEGLTILEAASNGFLSVDIESGPGRLGENVLVRSALKLGTDRAALAELVRPDLTTPGNDSPVGPLYGERHLDVVPPYDPEAAALQLVEAGFTGGLQLVLQVSDDAESLALAEAWRAQMEAIGVTVDVSMVSPPGEAAGDAAAEAPEADATITRSISEPSAFLYLERAYAPAADSDETRWSDPELEALVAELAAEPEEARRIDLYHRIQQILMDRGPAVVPFYETAVAGVPGTLQGVTPAPYWPRTTFRTASFGS